MLLCVLVDFVVNVCNLVFLKLCGNNFLVSVLMCCCMFSMFAIVCMNELGVLGGNLRQ